MSSALDPSRYVLVVDRDEPTGALLVRFLEARGWYAELVTDARRVIRQWLHAEMIPWMVVTVRDDDPDAFELLGALAAHAIRAHVVVCARRDLDLRAIPVERALPTGTRFTAIAAALDDLREGRVVPDAAE